MRFILPVAAALVLGSVPALADHDRPIDDDGYSMKDDGYVRGGGLYDRIVAHYGPGGKDVREQFRDGPCSVKRTWTKDGRYSESIRCRPRRD